MVRVRDRVLREETVISILSETLPLSATHYTDCVLSIQSKAASKSSSNASQGACYGRQLPWEQEPEVYLRAMDL